ncbi:hypothetical protein IFM89_027708 [Coptis chinensis]|uniref:AB hydrolase-1 domain-containing protein n=1 Tax=Coptis chinensis TaxID=261450 RepID=A0A835HXM1_9MAGN|nr:hypothetical protein IFM89_027708 [Coptis chinensis]
MTKKGCRRNDVAYTTLIHGLCEDERISEAFALYGKMGDDYCRPTVRTYTVLISALCRAGRRLEAFDLYRGMKERGCEPNFYTYNVLIDSLCKEKKLDDAHMMLNEILGKGLIPDVVTNNAFINGYCNDGKTDVAFQIMDSMASSGCKPNTRTYNEVIFGLCTEKKVHKAMAMFNRMLERDLKPSLVTYNLLICGQCKEGHLDSAFRLLHLMKEDGFAPDQWTYSMLIDSLCKKGRLEEASSLFDSLGEKSIKPCEVIYTALIDGYCKVGNMDFSQNLFEKMLAEKCIPNSHTYNVLIDGLCKEKKMDKASLLLDKMVEVGVEPTVFTYIILIDEMLKECQPDKVDRVFKQMISSGLKPDVCTYTSFIHTLCSNGKLEQAEDLMIKMNKEGIRPDLVTYTALLDGYGNSGPVDCAFDVLKRMVDVGCKPSHETYTILVKHFINEKRVFGKSYNMCLDPAANGTSISVADVWKILDLETALKLIEKMVEHEASALVDMMVKQGRLPNLESYKLLICGLCNKGNIQKAKTVFCTLLRPEHNYDEVAWKVLIEGLLKKGLVEECSKLSVWLSSSLDWVERHHLLNYLPVVGKVYGRLRFMNEFLPEDRYPVLAGPVVFFVFIVAVAGYVQFWFGKVCVGIVVRDRDLKPGCAVLSVNTEPRSPPLSPKKVHIHPPSATLVQLPNGRQMAYHERGVSAETARFSLFSPHSFLSSRLAGIPGIKESLLQDFGVRLITYDLPGFGESDPHPNRNLNTSALGMLRLADALGVNDKFWVVGYSGGGVHAWAALSYIPDKFAGAAMFAPIVNPYDSSMTKEERYGIWERWTQRRKLMHFLARRFPSLLKYFYRRSYMSGEHGQLDKWLSLSLGKKDKSLIEEPIFEEFWQRDVEESLRQGNIRPFVEEAVLQVSRWGFSLADIQIQRKRREKGIIPWLKSMYAQPELEWAGFLGPIHIWNARSIRSTTSQRDKTSDGFSGNQKKVDLPESLLHRFLPNKALSVTDLAGALWCEKKVEFELNLGKPKVTNAMKAGRVRHKQLKIDCIDLSC